MKKFLLVVACSLTFMGSAFAADFIGTGLQGTLVYQEPTENADAARSPLIDLDRTEYRTGNDVDGMGEWVEVIATSPNGGGEITLYDIVIPVPTGQVHTTGRLHIRACDDAGQRGANTEDNCSPETELTKDIDNLAPAGVQ